MRMKKNSKSDRRVRIIGVIGEIVKYHSFNYHVILILKNLLRIRKRKKSKERDKPMR